MTETRINSISGVILAGGTNTRFGGQIKTKQVVGEKRIIDRIHEVLATIFEEIILVTNTPGEFGDFKGIITGDRFRDKGPLGGIHAAMLRSSCDAIFVFAGDMPFPNRALILSEIEFFRRSGKEIVIPAVKDNIEPLHGIYSKTLVNRLEDWLSSGNDPEVRKFIGTTDSGLFPLLQSDSSDKAFTNINSPGDIDQLDLSGMPDL